MSDISLSLVALWEKEQFLYNRLLTRKTLQCLFIKSVKFLPEKNFVSSALEKFPFRNLAKTRQIICISADEDEVLRYCESLIKPPTWVFSPTKTKENLKITCLMIWIMKDCIGAYGIQRNETKGYSARVSRTNIKFSYPLLSSKITWKDILPVAQRLPKEVSRRPGMESQMVQNSRNKIGLTFNKFVIKVKRDFSQAQQNQFTFNLFSLKVKTFRIKLNKITSSLSRNYLSRARDIWVKLKRSLRVTFNEKFISISRFVSYQPQIPYHVSTTWPFKVKPRMLSTTQILCQQPCQALSTK